MCTPVHTCVHAPATQRNACIIAEVCICILIMYVYSVDFSARLSHGFHVCKFRAPESSEDRHIQRDAGRRQTVGQSALVACCRGGELHAVDSDVWGRPLLGSKVGGGVCFLGEREAWEEDRPGHTKCGVGGAGSPLAFGAIREHAAGRNPCAGQVVPRARGQPTLDPVPATQQRSDGLGGCR